jgi:hypothetical protein
MTIRIEAMVFGLLFFIALPVTASPPVPPTVASSAFSSSTNIECLGTVLESESYTNRWIGATDGNHGAQFVGNATVAFTGQQNVNESLPLLAPGSDLRVPVLGAGDSIGEIRYEEEFNAVNGFLQYNKQFDVDEGEAPNLDVDKTFVFVAEAGTNGNLSFVERTGLTVVSNGFDRVDAAPEVTGVVGGLCPWVEDGGAHDVIPATNELIAMGSEMSVTAVDVTTATSLGVTNVAPALSYAVAGTGVGFIEASMAAQIQEGFGKVGWVPSGAPIFTADTAGSTQADIDAAKLIPSNFIQPAARVAPALAQFEQYEETSSADGQWTFSKRMSYQSKIPDLQIPAPFDLILVP